MASFPCLRRTIRNIAVFCLVYYCNETRGQDQREEDEKALLKLYGNEEMLSIATGSKQPIAKAPAVATVITSENIKEIGATDLDEVLETVPGLHVARAPGGYNSIYTIRGIYSSFNSQVLFLLNGIPLTNLYLGDRNQVWAGMPVQSIARIEIIRGPGSAIYGADAFAGVINIITKTKDDIRGTEIGGGAGSFDTYDGWGLHGNNWAGFDIAAMLEIHDTNGQRKIIGADAQTGLDEAYGTHASLAPGPVNLSRQNIDARLDISRGNWRFRGGLQHRSNGGTGAGVAQALDPHGRFGSDRWNADLTYHNSELLDDWDVTAQISYFNTSQVVEKNVLLFPPGATFQTPNGEMHSFPNGVIGNPELYERHARANVSAFYTGFEDHTVRLGAGFNYSSIYDVKEVKNYNLDQAGIPIPLTGLTNVSNTAEVFLTTGSRKDYFIFAHDEWKFANDWELTAGVRYDYYSDFGSTINPRLALVWETRHNLTTKLLYGRAFRAPSWAEMRLINNPVSLGNPNLKPETINTIELAFDYRPSSDLRFGLNLFNYWWEDIIRFVPDAGGTTRTAQNTGQQTGYGLELETDWKPTSTFSLMGNFSFQKSTDGTTDRDAGYAPHEKIYLRADWEFLPDWHLNPQVEWVLNRQRPYGDTRSKIDDYNWTDLTIRRKRLFQHWEVAFSVRNLFNVDAREPSPAGIQSVPIPNDLPLAGRFYYGEIRFSF